MSKRKVLLVCRLDLITTSERVVVAIVQIGPQPQHVIKSKVVVLCRPGLITTWIQKEESACAGLDIACRTHKKWKFETLSLLTPWHKIQGTLSSSIFLKQWLFPHIVCSLLLRQGPWTFVFSSADWVYIIYIIYIYIYIRKLECAYQYCVCLSMLLTLYNKASALVWVVLHFYCY